MKEYEKRPINDAGNKWILEVGQEINFIRRRFSLINNNRIEEELLEEAALKDDSYRNIEKDLFIKFLYLSPYEIKLNRKSSQLNVSDSVASNLVYKNSDISNELTVKRNYLPLLNLSVCNSDNMEIDDNKVNKNRISSSIAKKISHIHKLSSFEDYYMEAFKNYSDNYLL